MIFKTVVRGAEILSALFFTGVTVYALINQNLIGAGVTGLIAYMLWDKYIL